MGKFGHKGDLEPHMHELEPKCLATPLLLCILPAIAPTYKINKLASTAPFGLGL